MAYLPLIGPAEAGPELATAYRAMAGRKIPAVYKSPSGLPPGIVLAHSLDPTLLRLTFTLSGALHDDATLTWPQRELVNAVTSRANQCFY